MRILIKFPSRSRPQIFLTRLKEWLDSAAQPALLSVLVSYDEDDATMTPEVIAQAEAMHPACVCHSGISTSKIHAINRDMDKAGDWGVVIVVSDDFFCRRKGWDDVIREQMTKHFPDTDGSLWIFDGAQRLINTLPCLGRKFYERFGYIYEPSYKSFWVDNEQTDVGLAMEKLAWVEHPIASHEHPSWLGVMKNDSLYKRNSVHWKADAANYSRRKSAGFPK